MSHLFNLATVRLRHLLVVFELVIGVAKLFPKFRYVVLDGVGLTGARRANSDLGLRLLCRVRVEQLLGCCLVHYCAVER